MPPFTVLHVCMGNICRSPMAERLLVLSVRERLARRAGVPELLAGDLAASAAADAGAPGAEAGQPTVEALTVEAPTAEDGESGAAGLAAALGRSADALVHSHSAGTGGWHAGEEMNPPAARLVRARGGDVAGFAARKLRSDHIDAADLVLTATADQQEYVLALRPDAAARTFVLGEFGRLLPRVDVAALPPAEATPEALYARGVALVAAVDAVRAGATPLNTDDLDDPWGRGEQCFNRVADEIEETVQPLAAILLP